MKQFIYILTGVLLLSACSRSSLEAEKSTIDSLLLAYQKLEAQVESMSTDEAKEHLATYKTSIELIKKNTNPNKMPSMESSRFIDAFRSVKKMFKKLPKKQSTLTQHIATNSEQLENLLEDIRNNLLSSNKLEEILTQEKILLNDVRSSYQLIVRGMEEEKEKLDSLVILLPTELEKLR
jgi:hypothetical protein